MEWRPPKPLAFIPNGCLHAVWQGESGDGPPWDPPSQCAIVPGLRHSTCVTQGLELGDMLLILEPAPRSFFLPGGLYGDMPGGGDEEICLGGGG